ncbi:MAG: hypothetical protein K0U98_27190 [Deltaproteobacteria bacterium]|nr:hypothetical protein [Deltaproteobacteria bacterium]
MKQGDPELLLVTKTIARLRAGIVAIVTGMVTGVGLFAATLWLVIKGGPNVGQNLGLLRAYYPGYSVTWGGSFLGLLYGAITGALLGWCVAWLYNFLATRRSNSQRSNNQPSHNP